MNPNLDACYWAEQVNRRRLADRAARGWLAQQAAASRPTEGEASKPRRAAGGCPRPSGDALVGHAAAERHDEATRQGEPRDRRTVRATPKRPKPSTRWAISGAHAPDSGRFVGLLGAIGSMAAVRANKRRSYELLEPRPGFQLLDLGCGRGYDTGAGAR